MNLSRSPVKLAVELDDDKLFATFTTQRPDTVDDIETLQLVLEIGPNQGMFRHDYDMLRRQAINLPFAAMVGIDSAREIHYPLKGSHLHDVGVCATTPPVRGGSSFTLSLEYNARKDKGEKRQQDDQGYLEFGKILSVYATRRVQT